MSGICSAFILFTSDIPFLPFMLVKYYHELAANEIAGNLYTSIFTLA